MEILEEHRSKCQLKARLHVKVSQRVSHPCIVSLYLGCPFEESQLGGSDQELVVVRMRRPEESMGPCSRHV